MPQCPCSPPRCFNINRGRDSAVTRTTLASLVSLVCCNACCSRERVVSHASKTGIAPTGEKRPSITWRLLSMDAQAHRKLKGTTGRESLAIVATQRRPFPPMCPSAPPASSTFQNRRILMATAGESTRPAADEDHEFRRWGQHSSRYQHCRRQL